MEKLVAFNGGRGGGVGIEAGDIVGKVLELAIPKGATAEQETALEDLIMWASQQGVKLIIKMIE